MATFKQDEHTLSQLQPQGRETSSSSSLLKGSHATSSHIEDNVQITLKRTLDGMQCHHIVERCNLIDAPKQCLERVVMLGEDQDPDMDAFNMFLSIVEDDCGTLFINSTILLCLATTILMVPPLSKTTLDGYSTTFTLLGMLSGISTVVLVGGLRGWLRSYRGMSPQGVRRHVKGSLVTLTRAVASAKGLLQMGSVMCSSVSVYVMPSFTDVSRFSLVSLQLILMYFLVSSWLVNRYRQREQDVDDMEAGIEGK